MSTRTLHVAILDVDVPVPTVYAARGLYSSQFRTLLQAAARRLNTTTTKTSTCPSLLKKGPVNIQTTAFDVVGGTFPHLEHLRKKERGHGHVPGAGASASAIEIDAILIGGSAASSYQKEKYPWIHDLEAFIRIVYEEYPLVKLFGSCFGHQIIAQALLSGTSPTRTASDCEDGFDGCVVVEKCPFGYEMGIQQTVVNREFVRWFPFLEKTLPLRLTHQGQDGASAPGQEEGEGQQQLFRLQLIHGDRVVPIVQQPWLQLPPNWINIAHTPKCPIQGLYQPGRVLTYQGHFEFDTFVNTESCVEFARREGWPQDVVGQYLAEINKARPGNGSGDGGRDPVRYGDGDDDDSKAAAEVVVLFFAGEDVARGVQQQQEQDEGETSAVLAAGGLLTPPMDEDEKLSWR